MRSLLGRPRTLVPSLAVVAALALGTVACGGEGDDDATATTTAPGAEATSPAPEEEPEGATPDGSIDACALLAPELLADTVAFEFGAGTWSEDADPEAGTCSWTNDEQLTSISVEVRQGIDDTLAGLRPGTGTELEDVRVGAATATGVRDTAADRLISLYVPAGADAVVKLTQSPLKVDDAAMVALAEAAARAYVNLPAGGGEAAPGGGEGDGTLEAVRFTVQSSDAGIDLELEVTAEQVRAEGNPISVGIICAGTEPGEGGLFEGVYAVSATDLSRDPGLVFASIESTESVDGPGTYPGAFRATDSQERSVDVEGQLTIDDGLRSGELIGEDAAGNQVAVTWECRPLG